jgi:hypothetical protein
MSTIPKKKGVHCSAENIWRFAEHCPMSCGRSIVVLVLSLHLIGVAAAWPTTTEVEGEPATRIISPVEGMSEERPKANVDSAPNIDSSRDPSVICQAIATAAAINGLPLEFFSRVIWQESRFKPNAVGPVTRSGQRAQGIAQFMPATAADRLLHDPFNPLEALSKSAEFLRELHKEFGNLGLAAAAYNAGAQRVRDWLAGKRTLPLETENYVKIITGRPAREWMTAEAPSFRPIVAHEQSCLDLVKFPPKLQPATKVTLLKSSEAWVVQLFGDRSEAKVVALFRELQKKHEAILRNYQPNVVRTAAGGASGVWARVRIDAATRQAAQSLCSALRAVGEECLVQRN